MPAENPGLRPETRHLEAALGAALDLAQVLVGIMRQFFAVLVC